MQVRFGNFFIPAQALNPGDREKIRKIPSVFHTQDVGEKLITAGGRTWQAEAEIARDLAREEIPFFYTPKALKSGESLLGLNPIDMNKQTRLLEPMDIWNRW